jgi:hypothetical protein
VALGDEGRGDAVKTSDTLTAAYLASHARLDAAFARLDAKTRDGKEKGPLATVIAAALNIEIPDNSAAFPDSHHTES